MGLTPAGQGSSMAHGVRDARTWPKHKAKARKRSARRAQTARQAQTERERMAPKW